MKVCMLAEMLPPAFGGAARQALQVATQLRQRGVEVFFVSAQVVPDSPREDRLNGFIVYRVPHAATGKFTKLRGLVGYWGIFWRHRREFDILHLHSANYLTLAAALFAKVILRKRLLIKLTSIASDIPSAILRRSYPRLTWWMFRQADAWVCMSRAQSDDCRRHGLPGDRVHLIPNGVDTQRFHGVESAVEQAQVLEKLQLAPAARYVAFIGTIEKDKGVRLLIQAAALVCQQHPDVIFLLIGPDGTRPGESHVRPDFVIEMHELIRSTGLAPRIKLLGHQTSLVDYLRIAALFAFPSRSEGFGTVVIEAMACSVPCVALNIPGVTSGIITTGWDGVIIERPNPGEFAKELDRILGDEALRTAFAKAARTTAVTRFDIAVVAQQYQNLYEKLLSPEV